MGELSCTRNEATISITLVSAGIPCLVFRLPFSEEPASLNLSRSLCFVVGILDTGRDSYQASGFIPGCLWGVVERAPSFSPQNIRYGSDGIWFLFASP